jgi:hypothetical protein
MLSVLGISDWLAAALAAWLAAQLPLGILVGFCLRRVNALPDGWDALAAADKSWADLLTSPNAVLPVLR